MSFIKEPTKGKQLKITHFPTDFQALIFRLWDMVPCDKIAEVLKTSAFNIKKSAEDMGLSEQGDTSVWLERGYISILKAVWNLLPYEQIYTLLNWDEERLEYILKEDDFLWVKLGEKCDCPPVLYRELTSEEKIKTAKIKEIVNGVIDKICDGEPAKPFDFFSNKYEPFSLKVEKEIFVDSTWAINYSGNDATIKFHIEKFKEFAKKFDITFLENSEKSINIYLTCISEDDEYRKIIINNNKIDITASTSIGVMRALYDIINLVESAGTFSFDKKEYEYKTKVKTRIVYPFCGLYADVLDRDINISFPEESLDEYAKRGVNGLWFQGVLYKILPYPFDERLSEGWEARLGKLKEIVERVAKYGIKIYLYINEPRDMPLSFFEKYPDLKGASQKPGVACLCSSHPDTHKYLKDALQMLCREVPQIGGFINITQSENCVLCYSRGIKKERYAHIKTEPCPVCSDKKASVVTAEIIKTMSDAVAEVDKNIKFFIYTWAWENDFCEQYDELLSLMPENAIALQVSEDKIKFEKGGIWGEVADYSLSIVGPGETAKKLWQKAREKNMEIAAKVQINTSWECSTAPFLPVYENVLKHMENLSEIGVEHMMLSWTLGGYMSDNIKISSSYFFESENGFIGYDEILKSEYGEYADKVKEAVKHFCNGFSNFPFSHGGMYEGPANAGAANLFYPEPTNLHSTMTCFPYDDLDRWRSVFPADIYENQYEKICKEWEIGLEIIKDMPNCQFCDMAYYGYTLFKASHNLIKYYIERNSLCRDDVLKSIIRDELEVAKLALKVMRRNSSIGFEAANHYYVTPAMLCEKIVQCFYLLSDEN